MGNKKMITDTLKALLVYCKTVRPESDEPEFTWDKIAKVLEPIYSSDMRLADIIHIVSKAYTDAINDRRFCIRGIEYMLSAVILSPVQSTTSIDMLGPIKGIETQYSVEQFYNAMLARMLNDLRNTRVDWLLNTSEGEFLNSCFSKNKESVENGT